ncbi:MAG: 2OG-Fe(II) oxygenase [Chitinophagales bacterium]
MVYIDLGSLIENQEELRRQWTSKKPFRYLVVDNFFFADKAELVLQQYPDVTKGTWEGTTYIHQKNKYQLKQFDAGSVLHEVFAELNAKPFTDFLGALTGIQALEPDYKLFGGGLHQSLKGAFLDVHVDFNYHPQTKYHRRLNVLVYMNKDWKDEYEGHLQLWDMERKVMMDKVSPLFNRMVMFETTENSFHGHPVPLNTPFNVSRKSLAVYYYTPTRPEKETAVDHNTVFVNTSGVEGSWKTFLSGLKALKERIFK